MFYFVFLFVPSSSESIYFYFKSGFLNAAGYSVEEFDGNVVARLCGMLTLPFVISYINLIAINRKKKNLLIGCAISNILFSINNIINLLISIVVLVVILANKEFKLYMSNYENNVL